MGIWAEVVLRACSDFDISFGSVSPDIQDQDLSEKVKMLVTQLCLILCIPMDCSPPGSTVHGILQARILEWVAICFCRGCSWPRNWTQVSCIAGEFFTIWVTKEAWEIVYLAVQRETGTCWQWQSQYLSPFFLNIRTHWGLIICKVLKQSKVISFLWRR